jgi:hypothetical protein
MRFCGAAEEYIFKVFDHSWLLVVFSWLRVLSFIKHAKSINFNMFVFNQFDFY